MHLSDKQTEIINQIQETVNSKQVKFLVFHEDKGYTVTYRVEEAMRMNKPIFVITQYNVVSFEPVVDETKVEIKKRVEMILSLERDEPRSEKQIGIKEEEENPFTENPFEPTSLSDEDLDRMLSDFDKGKFVDGMDLFSQILEHPTYVADLITITAYELSYNLDEMKRMLSYLKRLQPIYAEFYDGKLATDLEQIQFVAKQLLNHIGRNEVELSIFDEELNEKILYPIEAVEGMANEILAELLIAHLNIL